MTKPTEKAWEEIRKDFNRVVSKYLGEITCRKESECVILDPEEFAEDMWSFIRQEKQKSYDEAIKAVEGKIKSFMDIRQMADKSFEITELINYIKGETSD